MKKLLGIIDNVAPGDYSVYAWESVKWGSYEGRSRRAKA